MVWWLIHTTFCLKKMIEKTPEYCKALKLYRGLRKLYQVKVGIRGGPGFRGWWSYYFIKEYVGEPYPALEPLILTDPASIFHYADKIIKGRYLKGEEVLLRTRGSSQDWLSYYRHYILNNSLRKEKIYDK